MLLHTPEVSDAVLFHDDGRAGIGGMFHDHVHMVTSEVEHAPSCFHQGQWKARCLSKKIFVMGQDVFLDFLQISHDGRQVSVRLLEPSRVPFQELQDDLTIQFTDMSLGLMIDRVNSDPNFPEAAFNLRFALGELALLFLR